MLSTSLYFIVFGSAIGSRMNAIDGVSYGAFIIPGLIMLSLLNESISNASFGIYFPKFTGTIYEILSAPVSAFEIVCGYVGAAATKSIILGGVILLTARLFVPYEIQHPLVMLAFLVLTAVTFSMFGFVIGIWADGLREAADHSAADHHAADVPGRVVLLDQDAARALAEGDAVQPGRLPDQRFPLELLRHFRLRRWGEPGRHAWVSVLVHDGGLVDFQNGLPPEDVRTPWPRARSN